MGLTKCLAVVLAVAVVGAGVAAGAGGLTAGSAAYLASRQSENGGFAEQGPTSDAALTAWAALGLVAAGGSASERARALEFLRSRQTEATSDGDLALRVVALAALGETVDESLLARLRRHRPDVLVNETIWSVLALRAAGEPAPAALVQAILAGQAKSGGFPWSRGGKPDSNDTAAAIQALRAAGVEVPRSGARSPPSVHFRLRREASRSLRAVSRTRNRPRGQSRRSSAPASVPARRPSASSRACGARTGATATRCATPRPRCG